MCVRGGGGGGGGEREGEKGCTEHVKTKFQAFYVIIAGISISTLPLVINNTNSTVLFLKSLKGILCHKNSSKGQSYFN